MATISSVPPWSHLLPEILHQVLVHLHYGGDVARFQAVCRAWRSAARQLQQPLPWIMLPNGSFCTIGDGGGGGGGFFPRIPGLPAADEDDGGVTTCLGADGSWLALDCTDDTLRRTNCWNTMNADGVVTDYVSLKPKSNVVHKHNYLLHNPFFGKTVPLPELDAIIGDNVLETFEIRKVIMCSGSPEADDLVAVTTNSKRYPIIIICRRPGRKGRCWVLPHLDVFEVAFFDGGEDDKDKQLLYGITPNEDLIAFDLTETNKRNDDGRRSIVCKFKRVIRHPLADGEEDAWSWMDDIDDYYVLYDDEDYMDDDEHDGEVPDGVDLMDDEEAPCYHPKDSISTTRRLVVSCNGKELLMVRHQVQAPPFESAYTRRLDIFKADLNACKWVLMMVTDDGTSVLAQGEALFLSRSSSKAIRAYGDIKEGSIYFVETNQVFDTRSGACKPFSIPGERKRAGRDEWLTWVFPPKLVV